MKSSGTMLNAKSPPSSDHSTAARTLGVSSMRVEASSPTLSSPGLRLTKKPSRSVPPMARRESSTESTAASEKEEGPKPIAFS